MSLKDKEPKSTGPQHDINVKLLTVEEKAAFRALFEQMRELKTAVLHRLHGVPPAQEEMQQFEPIRDESDIEPASVAQAPMVQEPSADLVAGLGDVERLDEAATTEASSPAIDLPFEPLDGQLTADDVQRLYGRDADVDEIAPGQFRIIDGGKS